MANKFKVGDRVKRTNGLNRNMSDGAEFKTGETGEVVVVHNAGWVDVKVNGAIVKQNNPANLELVVEPQFNVGDRVRIVNNNHGPHHHFDIGDTVRIKDINSCDLWCLRERDSLGQYVNKKSVELVSDFVEPNKIVITTDGKTTTAKLFHGKTEIKHATARCAPDDKFDFETGAGIAVARLLGREFAAPEEKSEPEKLFPLEDIKAGYLLKVRNTNNGSEFYMTVVPGLSFGEEKLGVCAPGKHWWALDKFGKELRYGRDELREIWGYCHNRFLLDNTTDDRKLLWSRK